MQILIQQKAFIRLLLKSNQQPKCFSGLLNGIKVLEYVDSLVTK